MAGQGCDGAAAMSGIRNGVENASACTHCTAHLCEVYAREYFIANDNFVSILETLLFFEILCTPLVGDKQR